MLPNDLHPRVRAWFSTTYGSPTPVQAEVWPRTAGGESVLAIAPTGSGKTLCAFLVALSRLADRSWPADRLSVLYISPLKALNEDIKRNLLEPLTGIEECFRREGSTFPSIRVETRSGDTPQSARRRFLSHPPSILATTPESLAILLLNPKARALLSTVRCVVLDEVHALLGTRRGAFLSCQLGRLSLLAGEFQRIALSATVRPPEAAAAFVAGGSAARPVAIVAPPSEKKIGLTVEFPSARVGMPLPGGAGEDEDEGRQGSARYEAMVERIGLSIRRNRSTLVFTDSRRRAERIAFLLNERFGSGTAFAHHGSLSKEVRRSVEKRLVAGELPCVVATGSLELGIDIGSVEEVILAGTPSSSSVALQRLGRSGHGVGLVSRGVLLPFHPLEILCASALASAVDEREIEVVEPMEKPLDILAQILLALLLEKSRSPDELFGTVTTFGPFIHLERGAFDRVVQMLTGRYADSRLRELKPRAFLDPVDGLLSAAPGILSLLYSSGGSIADRGCYSLRLADGSKIGELDEEFVWERRAGDAFSFGTRSWKIVSIGNEAVEVVPLGHEADFMPFWRAENRYRSPILSFRMRELLDSVNAGQSLGMHPGLAALSQEALSVLGHFLEEQRRLQNGVLLPGNASVSAEILCDPTSPRGELVSVILHTMRGRAVNEPLAMALSEELCARLSLSRVELIPDEDGILVLLPRLEGVVPATLMRESLSVLADTGVRHTLLRSRLESSGTFGAAFREAAEHSLLLAKAAFGKRTPLWITRLRAKRLFDAVSGYGDFPVIAEAWRTCLVDLFDMDGFDALCDGLGDGSISLGFFETRIPSPFSRELAWKETNQFLYEGDDRPGHRGASLSDAVIEEALGESGRRPALSKALVSHFVSRLRRELPGYAPEDVMSLVDWVDTRVAIPADEWLTLQSVLPDGLRESLGNDPCLGGRLWLDIGGDIAVIMHVNRRPEWEALPLSVLAEWLSTEGPVTLDRIARVFRSSRSEAEDAVAALVADGDVVDGVALEDGDSLVVERDNLALLLRLIRKRARPEIAERPLELLVPFLAERQGLLGGHEKPWELLSCYVAPMKLWETELFPARAASYRPASLDGDLSGGRLLWFGSGDESGGFAPPDDIDLVFSGRDPGFCVFGDSERSRSFWELRDASALSNSECVQALWKEVWDGRLSADSFEPVRRGLRDGFLPDDEDEAVPTSIPVSSGPFGRSRQIPRALSQRWKGGAPVPGLWYSLSLPSLDIDPLDAEALDRDRVRLLLRRWGVLCRSLLEREEGAFTWSRLLPAMRRLELSGELVAGRFFSGLPGLQFASNAIARELEAAEAVRSLYWMNATDPASPCGLKSLPQSLDFPAGPRISSARLYFRGGALVAVSTKGGKSLRFLVGESDPDLPGVLKLLRLPKERAVSPEGKIIVQEINGEKVLKSSYRSALISAGFEADRDRLVIW